MLGGLTPVYQKAPAMLVIRHLKEYEYPPSGEDWIAVTETPTGNAAIIVGLGRDRNGVYCLGIEEYLDVAVVRATEEALRLGVERLYIFDPGSLAN